jgi:hypothetical protein
MKDIKRQRKEAFGELGVASAPTDWVGDVKVLVNILFSKLILNSQELICNLWATNIKKVGTW